MLFLVLSLQTNIIITYTYTELLPTIQPILIKPNHLIYQGDQKVMRQMWLHRNYLCNQQV